MWETISLNMNFKNYDADIKISRIIKYILDNSVKKDCAKSKNIPIQNITNNINIIYLLERAYGIEFLAEYTKIKEKFENEQQHNR